MCSVLIFGGTTEGRILAEYCGKIGVDCLVSVATDYGASLLGNGVKVRIGRLDREQMRALMECYRFRAVIDATHPYAAEATVNIRSAATFSGTPYYRLLRDSTAVSGETARSLDELVNILNLDDSTVLSTLGSKSLSALTKIIDYRRRVWLRLLPTDRILQECVQLGFDEKKLIFGKGPFSVHENSKHIRLVGAEVLLTKESGRAGGYPEKIEAAKLCEIRTLTLVRSAEEGMSLEQIKHVISQFRRNNR